MTAAYPQPPARDPRRPYTAPAVHPPGPHPRLLGGRRRPVHRRAWPARCSSPSPLDQARWKVGLYLLLTFAPFAVAAPLIGPVIDRLKGGRRWMIIGSLAFRALLCVLIVRDLAHLTFYLEAFLMLVVGQGLPDLAGRGRAHHGAQRPGAGRGQLEAEPAQRRRRRRRPPSRAASC